MEGQRLRPAWPLACRGAEYCHSARASCPHETHSPVTRGSTGHQTYVLHRTSLLRRNPDS